MTASAPAGGYSRGEKGGLDHPKSPQHNFPLHNCTAQLHQSATAMFLALFHFATGSTVGQTAETNSGAKHSLAFSHLLLFYLPNKQHTRLVQLQPYSAGQ